MKLGDKVRLYSRTGHLTEAETSLKLTLESMDGKFATCTYAGKDNAQEVIHCNADNLILDESPIE